MAKKKVSQIERVMEYFVKCCNSYVNDLGLLDWDIEYRLGGTKTYNVAEVTFDCDASSATIRLNHDIKKESMNDMDYIKDTARHEVLHLLLGTLHMMAERSASSGISPDREVHRAIHRILKVSK